MPAIRMTRLLAWERSSEPMALLIDDTFATAPLADAIRAGLIQGGFDFTLHEDLSAVDIGPSDGALISSGEVGHLLETHRVSPRLAVVFDRTAPAALRTPVRPDEIERTPIRLVDISSSSELLARATLDPFFGITPAGFSRAPIDDAEAVVIGGAAAMLPAEAGFHEDLGKAWYILTEAPFVSHVFIVPSVAGGEFDLAVDALRTQAETSRRAIRGRIADRTGLEKETLVALYGQTRFELDAPDRRALLLLLQLGNRLEEVGPYVTDLSFTDEPPSS